MMHLIIGSAIAVDTTPVVVRMWIPQRFIGTMLKTRIPSHRSRLSHGLLFGVYCYVSECS